MAAMPIARLQKFLTAPTAKTSSLQLMFWFSLSLTFAAIYGILALQIAFSSEYVVQDDARQHVFWMQRFVDAALFPNDLIANYFQSVAPPGYSALYRLMAGAGVEPMKLSKLLPLLLGLLTTVYCFGICMQLLPVPTAGFIATLLLNQNLWMNDDLPSATPRAFLYPLLLAFLYYLLRRSLLPCLFALALQGLFYPQSVFISAGILMLNLWRWERWRPRLSQNRRDYWFCAAGLGVALLVMLPYLLKSSEFGPVITANQARAMPEFLPEGRSSFFFKNAWKFWFWGERSGLLPSEWQRLPYYYFLWMLGAGLSLPMMQRYPSHFPLVRQLTSGIVLLPQLALASLGMFVAAHALLFKLHLPSRYTQHSLRILMALLSAIALTVLLDAIFHLCNQRQTRQKVTADVVTHKAVSHPLLSVATLLFTFAFFTALVLYPSFVPYFPRASYRTGRVPALYEFFQQQPKDILIASLAQEVDKLPTFSQRSILVGKQYAIPYHLGYYFQFRQRVIDLIYAQYSQDLKLVQTFIQKYGVDFWLLERAAFRPKNVAKNDWIMQYQPAGTEALARLEQGMPALASIMERCSVFQTKKFVVLQSECIAKLALD